MSFPTATATSRPPCLFFDQVFSLQIRSYRVSIHTARPRAHCSSRACPARVLARCHVKIFLHSATTQHCTFACSLRLIWRIAATRHTCRQTLKNFLFSFFFLCLDGAPVSLYYSMCLVDFLASFLYHFSPRFLCNLPGPIFIFCLPETLILFQDPPCCSSTPTITKLIAWPEETSLDHICLGIETGSGSRFLPVRLGPPLSSCGGLCRATTAPRPRLLRRAGALVCSCTLWPGRFSSTGVASRRA